jgi:hypothetical protein
LIDWTCIGDCPWKKLKKLLIRWKTNKAVGPDGIPIEFYRTCWDIVKQHVMVVFDDRFEHKIDLDRINYDIITLIPKSVVSDVIQKFRPICLLQDFFKIVTKSLTVRATPVMNKLLHPCQTTFVKERYIADGVMLL